MPVFKLPLSGDVVQSISPSAWFMSPIGSQFGLVNINLGQSSEPKVEDEVLSDVASYGKQLGRIGDALIVLLKHMPKGASLSEPEREALDALKAMLDQIADVKQRRGRPTLRPANAAAQKDDDLARGK